MNQASVSYDFAIVFGATGGIGSEVSRALAKQIRVIYLIARDLQKLDILRQEIETDSNTLIITKQLDFTSQDMNIQKVIESLNLTKNVGLVVNCVGTYLSQRFKNTTHQDICQNFLINAINPMAITANLIEYLMPQSLVINLGSSLGYKPKAQRVLSSAVKHAVRGFSLGLAEELAQEGIRVCLINPRSVATPLLKKNSSSESYQKAMPVEDIVQTIMMIIRCDSRTLFSEINVGAAEGFLGQ